MRFLGSAGLALCTFVCAVPATAAAQRPVRVSLGGGVSIPTGAHADAAGTGWHALGAIALSTLMQPIGLRADVAYNRFSAGDAATVPGDDITSSVASATANVTYRLPMTNSPASPYLIAGLGAYRSDCDAAACEADTRFGWNAGLGVKLYVLRVRSFAEVRFHRAGGAVQFIPATVGLTF